MASAHHHRRTTPVDQHLAGRLTLNDLLLEIADLVDQHGVEVAAQRIGMPVPALSMVLAQPESLRYALHALRFDDDMPTDLTSPQAVQRHAIRLAAAETDPYDLLELEQWRGDANQRELTSHA